MNSPYFSPLSSEQKKIIRTRERNLIPSYVLEETLNLDYIRDEISFKEQFSLASFIYSKVKRDSGETYIQHPLRMLKKINDLEFRNEELARIAYGHDTDEILRDYKHLFSNYSNFQRKIKKKYAEVYPHIQLLTPLENSSLSKTMQLEKLLKESSSLSSIQIPFVPFFLPIKIKIPIRLPLPLTVIAKIVDVDDNSYDQKRFRPSGVKYKQEQIEILRKFIQKNPSPFEQLSKNITSNFSGFPTNLIYILNDILNNAERNLNKIPKQNLEQIL